jgi:hypothetical protein
LLVVLLVEEKVQLVLVLVELREKQWSANLISEVVVTIPLLGVCDLIALLQRYGVGLVIEPLGSIELLVAMKPTGASMECVRATFRADRNRCARSLTIFGLEVRSKNLNFLDRIEVDRNLGCAVAAVVDVGDAVDG